jgi:predicted Rossmann fold nucleotide-binding protein DprA/Smf involved in DNA uptake
MKIAIVGSRAKWFANPDLVRERVFDHVATFPSDTIIISGAEPTGVDHWAAEAATLNKLVLIEYPAEWRRPDGTLNKGAGFARNRLIVSQADEVHAFWNEFSPGTKNTIQLARLAGKPVRIFPQQMARLF